MAKELVIDKEEIIEVVEKNSNGEIIIKLLETGGKKIVDARNYYFAKTDEDKTKPLPTGKGLWLDPETALLVGMAMIDAAEKAMKGEK